MARALRFSDLPPGEKIEFLDAARERHPGGQVTGPAALATFPQAPGWECGACGGGFPLDYVLVADADPECPICDAKGWDSVHPRGATS